MFGAAESWLSCPNEVSVAIMHRKGTHMHFVANRTSSLESIAILRTGRPFSRVRLIYSKRDSGEYKLSFT